MGEKHREGGSRVGGTFFLNVFLSQNLAALFSVLLSLYNSPNLPTAYVRAASTEWWSQVLGPPLRTHGDG